MSRSFKKHSVTKERWDKINYSNKGFRKKFKRILRTLDDPENIEIPSRKEWGYGYGMVRVYIPKPLMNQCEWESKVFTRRARWKSDKRCGILGVVFIRAYTEYCNCYGNKRGYYWKNILK